MKGWKACSQFVAMVSVAAFALVPVTSFAAGEEKPHAKVVKLDSAGKHDTLLLSGPPETVTMRSGLVILAPGQTVGKHSTGTHEEMLVILEGKGTMMFKDGAKLEVDANHILYCPPDTEHDMMNTGTGVLRYVYIVANAK
jgi:mannose-6-phosphate isomerase-like protein (cupin superfamily)